MEKVQNIPPKAFFFKLIYVFYLITKSGKKQYSSNRIILLDLKISIISIIETLGVSNSNLIELHFSLIQIEKPFLSCFIFHISISISISISITITISITISFILFNIIYQYGKIRNFKILSQVIHNIYLVF